MTVALRYSESRKQFVLVADQASGPAIASKAREAGFKFSNDIKQFVCPNWWQAETFKELAAIDAAEALRKSRLYYEASYDKGELGERVGFKFSEGKQLFPFQRSGVLLLDSWTRKYGSVLLADEQGLGKSVQFVAAVSIWPGMTLVTCPSFATFTWHRFFMNWTDLAPELVHVVTAGSEDPLRFNPKVVIVSYRLLKKVWPRLKDVKWEWWGADECHRLKNASTEQARAALGWRHEKGIIARRSVFITGTPVPKRPVGLYNLLSRRMPHVLGEYSDYFAFIKRYCGAWNDGTKWIADGAKNLDELNMRLRSYGMIRRLKKDVQPQLGRRTTKIVPLPDQPAGITRINKRQTVKTLGTDWRNMRALTELFKQSDAFSMLSELAEPKIPAVAKFCNDLLEDHEGDKLFIVYRHQIMGRGLADKLAEYGVVHIHGGVPMKKRLPMIDTFQSKEPGTPRVIIGQMEACKENLTLTAADQVVFAEMTWVPGDIAQIVDRVHRIGQVSETVTAWFPILRGTIEEHMSNSVVQAVEDINAILH
jgi:SWI/SNF-related matrix-associated actin-dependent regulator 1 of chromatin subfamily A